MSDCMCDFDDLCGGLGTLHCLGCGGDLCVCRCGGEIDCEGCPDCSPELDPVDRLGEHDSDEEDMP